MDVSSVPEGDQPKLVRQQEFQQQSEDQEFYYNPTQTQQHQSFDQFHYSYPRQFPRQQCAQSTYQLQQRHHCYYYQADYAAAYQPPPPHQHRHSQPVSAPVGSAPQPSDSDGAASLAQGQQYHHQPSAVVPDGLNPAAAVTSLTRLTQFAGTLVLAERAAVGFQKMMGGDCGPGPVGPLANQHPNTRTGCSRAGGSLQGHHRGGFGHCHVSDTPFHVTGNGKSKVHSRRFKRKGATSTASCPKPSAAQDAELTSEVVQLSTHASESSVQSVLASMKALPDDQPQQMAYCELCRVYCNSLQILEQHKNGKRHKKNLVRVERLQNAIKPASQVQHDEKPLDDIKPEVSLPERIQNSEVQEPIKNSLSDVASEEYRMETNEQNNVKKKSEIPVEQSADLQGGKSGMDRLDKKRHGMKCKMKNGQRGKSTKRSKASKTSRQPKEPPKPKVIVPVICNLCNVRCDTREVFDRHLSGKKHIAKFKRLESHPKGLQALYPPNPIAQTPLTPQSHQPCHGPWASLLQPSGYFPLQAHQAALATTCLDVQPLQSFMPQQFTSESNSSHNIAQQQVATKQTEIKQNAVPETIHANAA